MKYIVYFFSLFLCCQIFCSDEELQLDMSLYERMTQIPKNITKLSPKGFKNILYTAEDLLTNNCEGKEYISSMIKHMIARCLLLSKEKGKYSEGYIIAYVCKKLPHCKNFMTKYLLKYFKNNSIEDEVQGTDTVLYATYDEDNPVEIINYGDIIQKYIEKKDSQIDSLISKLSDWTKEVSLIEQEIYQKQQDKSRTWLYSSSYGKEIKNLLDQKKAIDLESKKKEILKDVRNIEASKKRINFEVSHEPWGKIIDGSDCKEKVNYFSHIKCIGGKYVNVQENYSSNTNNNEICYYNILKTNRKKEIQKGAYFGNKFYSDTFVSWPYVVCNSKKYKDRLLAELYKNKKCIFSSEYDDKKYRTVISPDGSQVAFIGFQEQLISVYDLVEKEEIVEIKSEPINLSELSLPQLYHVYKKRIQKK